MEVNFSRNANHVSNFVKPSDGHRSRGPETLAGDLFVPTPPPSGPGRTCGLGPPLHWSVNMVNVQGNPKAAENNRGLALTGRAAARGLGLSRAQNEPVTIRRTH